MAVQDLVLIDTCIWVPFFNRPRSREKQSVDELLDDDRAALVGPILTEVLLGFRRDERAVGRVTAARYALLECDVGRMACRCAIRTTPHRPEALVAPE